MMCKGAICLMVVAGFFCLGNAAFADITEIEVITEYGGKSTFDADGGTWGIGELVTTFNDGALLKTDTNPSGTFYYSTATSTTSLQNSLCAGGVVQGEYDGDTWSVQLYTDAGHTNLVLDISGIILWYDEIESIPQSIDGRALCHISSKWIDTTEFPDTNWGGDGVTCGYRTTSTNFVWNPGDPPPYIDPEDYDTDFASELVTMNVYADPTGIPEPASLSLLMLGGLALLRKRR